MAPCLDVAAAIQRRRRALAAAGLDPDLAVTRGPSFSNEVWIGDEVVVRINHAEQPGGDPARMLREAAIAARLPREARYPEVLDAGREGDMAWIVMRRMPGQVLGRAWGAMRVAERERAITELAEALAAVHATQIGELDAFDLEPPHTLPLALIDAVIVVYPWLLVVPAIAMGAAILALNFIGDGIRDALDPRRAAASGRRHPGSR